MDGTSEAIRAAIDGVARAVVLGDASEPDCLGEIAAALGILSEACPATHEARTLAEEALALLDAARGREQREVAAAIDAIATVVARLQTMAEESPRPSALSEDAELLADFIASCEEQLESAEGDLMRLEATPGDSEALNALFRCFHTIKGMAGFMALGDVESASHTGEELLSEARASGSPLDAAALESLFAEHDRMRRLVRTLNGAKQVKTVSDSAREEVPHEAAAAEPAYADATFGTPTVRVDARKLDRLLEAIGELAIAESAVSRAAGEGAADELRERVDRLDKLTRGLQEMATGLRMVTMRSLMKRMSRAVRDVCHRTGKDIDFVTTGAETELDRSLVDALADPLVHLLRNAVDHGIEPADRRVAAGKPSRGRIELRAFHRGGSVYVEVEDDGKGLDLDAVRRVAAERGLLPGHDMTEAQLLDLIFAPGFSTAGEVTDVSGRGVGMDAVRDAISALRGQVEVTSSAGRGCVVSIRLPLTLASIEGMVVRAGGERFVLPALSVVRCLRLAAVSTAVSHDGSEMLRDADEVMPLLRLARVFGHSAGDASVERAVAVVVEDDGKRCALVVDELLDQQQLTVKPLTAPLHSAPGVAGASVMPDGAPALIVDVAGVIRVGRSATSTGGRASP